MISTEKTSQLEILRDSAHDAARAGHYAEALGICDQASALAATTGETALIDRATCNRAAVLISLERGDEVLAPLRSMIMRTADQTSRHLAAYNIARFYEYQRNSQKGLFYAKIAVESARCLDCSEWLTGSLNQLGNHLLTGCYFEEALKSYTEGFEHLPPGPSVDRTAMLGNIGYSWIMLDQIPQGFTALFQCLRMIRSLDIPLAARGPHLYLCYAYLEVERYRRAIQHGLAALELSERTGDTTRVKNCLYLLGEATKLSGEIYLARSYFNRLQEEFYPDQLYLTDILLSTDVRSLVNLS